MAKDFDEPMRLAAGWVSFGAMTLGVFLFAITIAISVFKSSVKAS
jgi:hypothetical protein